MGNEIRKSGRNEEVKRNIAVEIESVQMSLTVNLVLRKEVVHGLGIGQVKLGVRLVLVCTGVREGDDCRSAPGDLFAIS